VEQRRQPAAKEHLVRRIPHRRLSGGADVSRPPCDDETPFDERVLTMYDESPRTANTPAGNPGQGDVRKAPPSRLRCPSCDRRFDPSASTTMPFCCERCRMADLNGWLEEHHGLPYVDLEADEQDETFE
jgi:endogenous inhibitor of DNA gyrase (YacG/DUF329 family)